MSEAFIPPAAATPAQEVTVEGFGTGTVPELEHAMQLMRDELDSTKRDLEAAQKRELEHQPLFEAIEYVVYRHLERWIDSQHGREILGRVLEDLQGSAIDDALERALSNATVEVEAYLSL